MTLTFTRNDKDKPPRGFLKRRPRRTSKRLRQVSEVQISKPAFASVRSRQVKFS